MHQESFHSILSTILIRLSIKALQNYVIRPTLGLGTVSKVYQLKLKSVSLSVSITLLFPNFIKFHQALSDNENYYLMTELVNDGTLLQYFNPSQHFSENDVRITFLQNFDGVSSLHSMLKIAHLSIK
jgi:serine/threonine protein kinase